MIEKNQESVSPFENPAVRNGVIAGIGGSMIILVLYLVSQNLMIWLEGVLSTIFFIFLMVRSISEQKKLDGDGVFTFMDGLRPAFLTYAVGTVIYTLFYYVLFNFIDTGLADARRELAMNALQITEAYLPEDQFEAQMLALENQEYGFGGKVAFLSFGVWLLFGFVFAAIVAAIMKDRKPVDA